MFYHALDAYMKVRSAPPRPPTVRRHAPSSRAQWGYPWDELRPLRCEGRRWDRRERGTLDDSLGGCDGLCAADFRTLALTRGSPGFKRHW